MLITPVENKFLHTPTIQPYYVKSFQKLQFESNDFIYEIIYDKIYKMKYFPTITTYALTDSIHFAIKNEDVKRAESMYIPINLEYKKITVDKYKLHQNSLLTLYIENNKSFHFHTDETSITHSIKEEMITFLSLLKLYN